MNGIEIIPLKDNSRDIRAFVACQRGFYRGNPYWVAPFPGERREFILSGPYREVGVIQAFLARRDGAVVGRIMAHYDRRHNEFFDVTRGCFGFFECIDDTTVSRALFDAAAAWLREQGMTSMEGPYQFMVYDAPGVLMDDFKTIPAVALGYNPPYYARLLEDYGLAKVIDWYAYLFSADQELPSLYRKFHAKVRRDAEEHKGGLVVRNASLKHFEAERARIMTVFNEAWGHNWGHYPLTEGQWNTFTGDLKRVVIEELVILAEYHGETAGFIVSLPDVNQALHRARGRLFPLGWLKVLLGMRRISRLKTVIMGVLPKYRLRGLDAYFVVETIERGRKRGYRDADLSLVVEDNMPMRNAIEHLGGRIYKTYRIFGKSI